MRNMKIPNTGIFIFMAFLFPMVMADDDLTSPPKGGFTDFWELKTWAYQSSFGGGFAKKLLLGGREVYYTDRCFTSGIETTQVTFFYKNKKGHIVPYATLPTHRGSSSITLANSTLVKLNHYKDIIKIKQVSPHSMDIEYTLKAKNIPKN